ncbi:uncharacterized protein [Miscanthus floridulus]|uniref:uncharacterized protein n=1 Tax=Miscanthus floridulus TaxID=154761 RepID=UPI003457655D
MDAVLKYFGFSSLRPYQRDVVDAVRRGRDYLVVIATGGGKSMCYQLPLLLTKKTAIVISPLLSLMQDQVMNLQQRGVRSDYLGSTQKNHAVVMNYAQSVTITHHSNRVTLSFWSNMIRRGICLLVVDEAHCIPEWGPDFRIEYKMLHRLRAKLFGIPFLALTAMATDRPGTCINEAIAELIRDVPHRVSARESTIIYCITIRDTEQPGLFFVHDALKSLGVDAKMYHGQMDSALREAAHKSFVTDEVFVMVATIAFRMDIDKPDVRCVIHFGCPKSLESYYQESGRCGQDGLPSTCLLYYSRSDFSRGDFYCAATNTVTQKEVIMSSFFAAQSYCVLATCRRQHILNYFREAGGDNCGYCDNCTSRADKEKDLSTGNECGGRWGLNFHINMLRGSHCKKVITNNFQNSEFYGLGKSREANWWKGLGGILLANGYLNQIINGSYRFVSISADGEKFLHSYHYSGHPLILRVTDEMLSDDDYSTSSDPEIAPELDFLSKVW